MFFKRTGAPILLVALFGLFTNPLFAAGSHTAFITRPISSGPEVTKQCLKCHKEQVDDFMKTSHWTWATSQQVKGKTVVHGKKNAINNLCPSIASNEPRCASCHAGYGWADNSFDFTNQTAVDCLVCHDTTGTYIKEATAAGNPSEYVDLVYVAQNVGKPVRDNCGSCHFFAGGGDSVKHGDLDSTLSYPDRNNDVHMASTGNNFQCQDCHVAKNHKIPGHSLGVSPGGTNHFGCEGCHEAAPHKESRLNEHVRVACQSCHIPFFAKDIPTKLGWDWSTAGEDRKVDQKDQYGQLTYMKKNGDSVWGKRVVPEYAWDNGTGGVYRVGDKINPKNTTRLAYPLGDINDKIAKIRPFKVLRGKQIYDSKNNYLITPKMFGTGGYWKEFNWKKAATLGMQDSGLPFSGEYGFAPTIMYRRINHMVAPKDQALRCLDCHGDQGRMDWKGLGFQGDPINAPKGCSK